MFNGRREFYNKHSYKIVYISDEQPRLNDGQFKQPQTLGESQAMIMKIAHILFQQHFTLGFYATRITNVGAIRIITNMLL